MTTQEQYAAIAQSVYLVDPMAQDPPAKRGDRFPPENPQFEVVSDPKNDSVSGFQGMAVAPLVKGEPDYSHIFVAFAGTNPDHHADINTDIQAIVGGQATAAQVAQARAYAEKVRAEILEKHPDSQFTTVGHSLGGYLAMFIATELHWSGKSFNGPDPWDDLSPEDQEWLRARIAEGKNPLDNWVNEYDLIANFRGNGTGAAHYVRGKSGGGLFDYHNIESGFSFKDGDVEGVGVQPRSRYEIMHNLLSSSLSDPDRAAIAALLASVEASLQVPGVGKSVAAVASAALVGVDTVAAYGLTSSVLGATLVLEQIKAVNNSLVPEMQQGLDGAKQAVHGIPFITEADIENCVIVQRLRVEDNIDEDAVAAMNRRIDDHRETALKLSSGIARTVLSAQQQDDQWAATFATG